MDSITETTVNGFTIRVNRSRCIATTNCIKVAPEVFALDSDDVITVQPGAKSPGRAMLAEACSVCPVDALELVDPSGDLPDSPEAK